MNEIRKLIVAGNGALAWIAAAALLRAFGFRKLEVLVVDTGASRDTRVGRWTLPSQRGMHALLGVSEPQFIQATGATFKLGTEHRGWQGDGSRFLHAHGDIGTAIPGTSFYRFLQAEGLAGRAVRPEEFSIAAVAARLGRFARPTTDGNSLTSSFTYGFHLEDAAYTRFLRAHAIQLGVRVAPAGLAEVVRGEHGDVAGLRLLDGSVVSADFHVDCSGPEARLLSAVSAEPREDWSAWLPCDRMWSALAPPLADPPAVTQTIATAAGWAWTAPLVHGCMVGHVYSSRFQDENAARAGLQTAAPTLLCEPVLTSFSPGRRRQFWARNCVALGAAAVEIEPLAGAELQIAQLGLANLIELFPLALDNGIEAAEYNRLMAEHADSLRDFTIAHYRAGRARPGDFGAATRAVPAPARLAHKLDLYAASGRIDLLDQEIFEEIDWAWLLMGSGCVPDALEWQVRDLIAKVTPQQAELLRARVAQLAASMPRHLDFVQHQATIAARAAG
jgi:tryptophan halogenase